MKVHHEKKIVLINFVVTESGGIFPEILAMKNAAFDDESLPGDGV